MGNYTEEIVADTRLEENDAFVVDFHPNDDEDPHNWPMLKKVWVTSLLAIFNVVATVASSILGPGQKDIVQEFGVSQEVAVLSTTLFLVGYIFGFLTFGPLSERFGRKWPLLSGLTISFLFDLMPALGTNITIVLIGRFFAGFFGVAPVAIMGGIISDCFEIAHRGIAMALTVSLVFSGPTFGPVIGGLIIRSPLSWRWTMWVVIIAGLALSTASMIVFPETYPPSILRKRATAMRIKYGNPNIKAALENESFGLSEILRKYLIRPFWLFTTQPILVLLTLYQSILYGILFLFYQSYPFEFGEIRGWEAGLNTLPLLGIITGVFIGTAGVVIYNQTYFRYHCHAADGTYIPESRLPPMVFGGAIIPIGIFWYAWTSKPDVPWPIPVCSGLLIGCGMYLLFIQGFNYIVDCYTSMANSALGVNGSMRSIFGAVFPLFASQMFHNLGVAYATTILGAITVCLVPIPICFWYWGDRIRAWSSAKVAPL